MVTRKKPTSSGMIYPFMLRRTKEQVAKDLPDKTEMILWCSMEKDQRYVYDEYKEYYRDMLMQKIDEGGLAKAGIYVLEGLLRLRQICDHPALLKEKKGAGHRAFFYTIKTLVVAQIHGGALLYKKTLRVNTPLSELGFIDWWMNFDGVLYACLEPTEL